VNRYARSRVAPPFLTPRQRAKQIDRLEDIIFGLRQSLAEWDMPLDARNATWDNIARVQKRINRLLKAELDRHLALPVKV
jgi:hypothetical protein